MTWPWLTAVACASAMAADLPRIEIPVCPTAPTINGVSDDPCWERASAITDFVVFRRGPVGSLTHDTKVLLTRDQAWLYVAACCWNPDMQHLNQAGVDHDDDGIWRDDSLEVLVGRSDGAGRERTAHYIVNYAGAKAERFSRGKAFDKGWSVPWVSAARAKADRWEAEMAIPLYVVNSGTPSPLRVNLIRNRIEVAKDRMGAKLGEKKVISCWALHQMNPNGLENFGFALGLDRLAAQEVFLPQIVGLSFGEYELGTTLSAKWTIQLQGFSSVPGRVKLMLRTETAPLRRRVVKDVEVRPLSRQTIEVQLPLSEVAGPAGLELVGTSTAQVLQVLPLKTPGSLISDVFSDRNYYTAEPNARVRCRLALSDATGLTLRIEDADGRMVVAQTNPGVETELALPMAPIGNGANRLSARLVDGKGRALGSRDFSLVKLPPKPGREIKIDQFRRILLRNGKPFFMFGMKAGLERKGMVSATTQEGQDVLRLMAETGFNTALRAYFRRHRDTYHFRPRAYLDLAQQHGLMVIDWDADFLGVDRATDMRECYQDYLDAYQRDFEVVTTYPNLLAYYNVDEPNLGNWQARLKVCEWYYRDLKQMDPYRPVFGLFACSIPKTSNALAPFDILGYDPYIYPGWRDYARGDINFVARETFELEQLVAPLHKPMVMVLIGTALDPRRCPLALSYQEQLNQAYASIIYGARGILYFAKIFTWGKHTWDAFRTLRKHLDVLEPAILSEPPAVDLSYQAKVIDPERGIFPMVHAAFFRYPDGRYLLLAANGQQFPVDVQFTISGAKQARRLFGDGGSLDKLQEAWTDRIEALGVQAIEIEVAEGLRALRVVASETGHPEQIARKAVALEDVFERVSTRRNKMPNPSFELDNKIPGAPDFYQPWLVKDADQIGDPAFDHWRLDTENPRFGKYCMKLSCPEDTDYANGLWCVAYLPNEQYPQQFVFSCYLRSTKDGEQQRLAILHNRAAFRLTTAWQRYSMKVRLKKRPLLGRAGFMITPNKGSTIWIDGLQLGHGDRPTEFTEAK